MMLHRSRNSGSSSNSCDDSDDAMMPPPYHMIVNGSVNGIDPSEKIVKVDPSLRVLRYRN